MNADTIPFVSPMLLRKFTFTQAPRMSGGYLVATEYDIEVVGEGKRNDHDQDVIDVSHGIFRITTEMMMTGEMKAQTVFPSRRWHNFTGIRFGRRGSDIVFAPIENGADVLFLGNPVRLLIDPGGAIRVMREDSYIIKSGIELGY